MAWELGFDSIILEEDTKEIFSNFGTWKHDLSHIGTIMHYAIHITSWFSYFKVCYAPRHCNEVTYCVANLARFADTELWIGECPSCIETL